MKNLRIAQVAPLYESVPPQAYGGTERVVSYLTEELVRQGHEVTLFASADSITQAKLVPCAPRSLRTSVFTDPLAPHLTMLERVYAAGDEFDVIHFHVDYLHYPVTTRWNKACVTTLHGRLDIPELKGIYREFPTVPVISISNAQRGPFPGLNWCATVHHGLPPNLYRCNETIGKYLAFLGRISPEKGVDKAIEIASQFGMELKIAAKVDRADEVYFREKIEPLLRENSHVEFIGEIQEHEKAKFLGEAYALLFPINWPEPFGMVMIEAMANGTPVVAFPMGSVPEVMEQGRTGFVVQNTAQAVEALAEISTLSRRGCRKVFEERFTAERMAHDYLKVYQRLAGRVSAPLPLRALTAPEETWPWHLPVLGSESL